MMIGAYTLTEKRKKSKKEKGQNNKKRNPNCLQSKEFFAIIMSHVLITTLSIYEFDLCLLQSKADATYSLSLHFSNTTL